MDDGFPAFVESASYMKRACEVARSFESVVGRPLIKGVDDEALPHALYSAAFVVVSHGAEADPILNFANAAALELWNVDFATFCQMPSRLTAEPVHRDERADMLARVTRDGFIDDYAGIRIAVDGRRFRIEQAYVWNVHDADGSPAGQAAMFDRWAWLDD